MCIAVEIILSFPLETRPKLGLVWRVGWLKTAVNCICCCSDVISSIRDEEGTFARTSDQHAVRHEGSLAAEAISGPDKWNDLRL